MKNVIPPQPCIQFRSNLQMRTDWNIEAIFWFVFVNDEPHAKLQTQQTYLSRLFPPNTRTHPSTQPARYYCEINTSVNTKQKPLHIRDKRCSECCPLRRPSSEYGPMFAAEPSLFAHAPNHHIRAFITVRVQSLTVDCDAITRTHGTCSSVARGGDLAQSSRVVAECVHERTRAPVRPTEIGCDTHCAAVPGSR